MSKSSVKRNTFRITFRTKSDQNGPMAKSSVKRNTFDRLPGTTSAVATGSKEVVKSITFYTTFGHGPILVTFGPKSDAKSITFHTTFRH